ncbi:MAG TPA: hypothetical protein ENJ95_07995 [Bacteroidetes bacterium]|nr:hypothetical protein [Bacteroidota bacterium]
MLATREPLGRFIVLAHNEKGIITKSSIEQEIDDLVDIIKVRVQSKKLKAVAESLYERIFEIRFDVIEWSANQNISVSDYLHKINHEIANKLQLAHYSDLAKEAATVLDVHEKIFSPIAEKLTLDNFGQLLDELNNNKPTYETIKLLSIHPAPQIQYLKKWLDTSLDIEFGLILSDLILTGQIEFSKKRINELILFLKDTINRYGAYSIFTGFWQPCSDDVSNLTNKMQILAATIEMDNNIYYKTSKEELFNFVNN